MVGGGLDAGDGDDPGWERWPDGARPFSADSRGFTCLSYVIAFIMFLRNVRDVDGPVAGGILLGSTSNMSAAGVPNRGRLPVVNAGAFPSSAPPRILWRSQSSPAGSVLALHGTSFALHPPTAEYALLLDGKCLVSAGAFSPHGTPTEFLKLFRHAKDTTEELETRRQESLAENRPGHRPPADARSLAGKGETTKRSLGRDR